MHWRTVEQRVGRPQSRTLAGLPPFQGGAAGLFAYDLNRGLERVPLPRADEFQLPALAIGLYDVVVAFDHALHRAWIVSQGLPEEDEPQRSQRATARLDSLSRLLVRPRRGRRRAAGLPRETTAVRATDAPVSVDESIRS